MFIHAVSEAASSVVSGTRPAVSVIDVLSFVKLLVVPSIFKIRIFVAEPSYAHNCYGGSGFTANVVELA